MYSLKIWTRFKNTDVWSADGEVAVDGHHRQQANAGHAKEDIQSCINLKANQQVWATQQTQWPLDCKGRFWLNITYGFISQANNKL